MTDMGDLENQIRDAFGCKVGLDTLTDDGYAQLKWKLSALEDKAAKRWLPLALIHEIRKAPTTEGDAIVYFLDARMAARGEEPEIERLRSEAEMRFGSYTVNQAEAILAWLGRVARLHYGELCGDDIESAVGYWSSRCRVG